MDEIIQSNRSWKGNARANEDNKTLEKSQKIIALTIYPLSHLDQRFKSKTSFRFEKNQVRGSQEIIDAGIGSNVWKMS